MIPPIFATLPEMGYLILACVVVAIIALIGVGVIVSFGRKLVKDIAEVVGSQIERQEKPVSVAVQQPVEFKDYQGPVTREEWNQAHGRITRERREIDLEIKRVELAAAERAKELADDLKANTALTQTMSGEVKQINQNVSLVLTALTTQK